MIIKKLYLTHFGKFENYKVEFESGINIILGNNEAGKSTIHSFIYAMLFGLEKARGRAGKDDKYTKYLPWNTKGAFQGSMDFEHDGINYRLSRVFYQKEKDCILINLETGKEVKLIDDKITSLIPSLTESVYKNTISIEQCHAKTDLELADSVKNYIANMQLAKSEAVDVRGAIKELNDKRKELEKKLAQNEIEVINQRIEELKEQEKQADEIARKIAACEKDASIYQKEKEEFINSTEYNSYKLASKYPIFNEKYESIKSNRLKLAESTKKLELLEAKLKENNELVNKESISEEENSRTEENIKQFETKISETDNLISELEKLREARLAVDSFKDEETEQINTKKMGILPISLILVGIIVCFIFNNLWMPGIFAGVVLCATGLIIGMFAYLKYRGMKIHADAKRNELVIKKREAAGDEEDFIKAHGSMEELRKKLSVLIEQKNNYQRVGREIESILMQIESIKQQIEEYQNVICEQQKQITEFGANFVNGSLDAEVDQEYIDLLSERVNETEAKIKDKLESIETKLSYAKREQDKLKWEISSYQDVENNLLDLQEKLLNAKDEKDEISKELAAMMLAIETILELANEIHDSFGKELNQEISKLTSKITMGNHSEVFVDEALSTTISDKSFSVDLGKFSVGTIDQVYLALRLAVARMFFSELNMPLIFDDTFAYYDDLRLEETIKELASYKVPQIIIFSCHDTEKIVLDKLGTDYHSIAL